jgi:hypothetical protein
LDYRLRRGRQIKNVLQYSVTSVTNWAAPISALESNTPMVLSDHIRQTVIRDSRIVEEQCRGNEARRLILWISCAANSYLFNDETLNAIVRHCPNNCDMRKIAINHFGAVENPVIAVFFAVVSYSSGRKP